MICTPHHPHREKEPIPGFSLVELLVVVAVLAILAAIAIPVFLNQKNKALSAQTITRTRELVMELETYRTTLPPDTNLDVSKVAADLAAYHSANPARVNAAVMRNCALNSAGTAAYPSPGNYIISARAAAGPATWTNITGTDTLVYNSADSKSYTNNTTANAVVSGAEGPGTSRTECAASWYGGAVFLQSNR